MDRESEPLQQGSDRAGSGESLRQLVGDVTGIEIREHEDVRPPGDRRARSLALAHRRNEGRVRLQLPVEGELRRPLAEELGRPPHLVDAGVPGAPVRRERQERDPGLVPDEDSAGPRRLEGDVDELLRSRVRHHAAVGVDEHPLVGEHHQEGGGDDPEPLGHSDDPESRAERVRGRRDGSHHRAVGGAPPDEVAGIREGRLEPLSRIVETEPAAPQLLLEGSGPLREQRIRARIEDLDPLRCVTPESTVADEDGTTTDLGGALRSREDPLVRALRKDDASAVRPRSRAQVLEQPQHVARRIPPRPPGAPTRRPAMLPSVISRLHDLPRRAPTLVALALLAAGSAGAATPPPPPGPDLGTLHEPGTSLSGLERVWVDPMPEFPPIERSGLVVEVSSPAQRVVVHRTWLHLRELPDASDEAGALWAEIVVDLEGEGLMVADLSGGGIEQRFADEVTVPRQVLRVAGRIDLRARDDGGVDVVLRSIPRFLTVRVESGLAGQLVGLCRGFDALPFVSADCAGLEAALVNLEADLPPPGSVLRVPAEALGDADLAFLRARAIPAGPPAP